jgi:hypothetical protein
MPSSYDVGDSVKLTFSVSVNGTATDATVALVVTKPDGTPATASVVHPGPPGAYEAVVSPDQPGLWVWRWTATGAATTAEDGSFVVDANVGANLYVSVAELLDQFGATTADVDPARMEQECKAASRAVDKWCRRRFWQNTAPVARRFVADTCELVFCRDIASVTGLLVATDDAGNGTFTTAWSASSYQLEPLDADADGGAYCWTRLRSVEGQAFPWLPYGRPGVKLTARWGWSQVPDPVRDATRLLATRLYLRKDAPFGNEGGFSEMGPVRIVATDPDMTRLLRPFRKIVIG